MSIYYINKIGITQRDKEGNKGNSKNLKNKSTREYFFMDVSN